MRKIITSIILIALWVSANAQKTTKEIKGDEYYSYYSYDKAIESYTGVKDLSIEGQRRLAESYHFIDKNTLSEQVYSRFINEKGVTADDYYNYASVLKSNGKYDQASKWMDKFKELKPNDLRAKNYAADNSQLTNLLKDQGRYKIAPLDVNTADEDFGTTYYKNKIVFASSRESGGTFIKREYNWNRKPFLDLYVSDVSGEQLLTPKNFDKGLNGKLHDGPASFANDGNTIAFTRNNYTDKSKDGVVKLQIYFSTFKDGKWQPEEPFELNNSEYSVGHPCLTEDGNTMYFTSDMPGGYGGADLYRIKKDDKGKWGKPENLGDQINTEGNEMFPYYQEDLEVLFWSSNGKLGLGGLDIFTCGVNSNGKFVKIYNPGFPLNTQSDDFALITNDKGSKGYFSSNRSGGKGDDDIYSWTLLKGLNGGKRIKGVAKDKKTGDTLANTFVQLFDDRGNVIDTVTTKKNGAYSFTVDSARNFKLTGTRDKYYDGDTIANTFGKEEVVKADLLLSKDLGFLLYCLVTEQGSGQILEGVKIKFKNNVTKEEETIITPATGDFLRILKDNKLNDTISYDLTIEKNGYISKNVTYKKKLYKKGQYNIHSELNLSLAKLEVGADLGKLLGLDTDIDLGINKIYFDLDKFTIRPDAAMILDKIVKVMNQYPSLVIELGSHTDCRASKEYNQVLSNNRAVASAAYIKKRIKNPKRIYGKGYGETKLTNGCACEGNVVSTCTEEEHQKNRRTEFIIVRK